MKVLFYFLLSLVLMNLSCKTLVDPSHLSPYKVIREDKSIEGNFPETGFYYEYRFSNYLQNFPAIEDSFRTYINSGVELLDAWYQHGSSSCRPPNSNIAFQVIVEPVLILRTKSRNEILLKRNFIETQKPGKVFCGYYVLHYIIN